MKNNLVDITSPKIAEALIRISKYNVYVQFKATQDDCTTLPISQGTALSLLYQTAGDLNMVADHDKKILIWG